MTRVLEVLPVHPDDPTAIVPALEEAIAGQRTLLPVPALDDDRADLLTRSLGAGEEIDPEVALVVSTSGSTGTPKGALLTPGNLVSSADATHQFLGGPGQWLLAMPAHHIAGLQVLIRSLVAGVEPASISVAHGFHVGEFASAARELSTTGDRMYTSLSPLQLAKAMDTVNGIDALRLFNAVLVGGAATSAQLLRAAHEMRINVVTTYGSSETSGGVVYNGTPIAGASVKVSGGRIFLGGPMVARGYRGQPGHEAFAHEGWFATSDGGTLDDDHLTVTGRLDAIIDSGGLKLHPEILEQFMLDIAGVDGACVVGVPDERLGQKIVAAYTGEATRAELLEAFDQLPRWQIPKELRHVDEFPLTGPGKVDRLAAAELFS